MILSVTQAFMRGYDFNGRGAPRRFALLALQSPGALKGVS